ncbi:MAG: type VI secretion system baseplate subunit TssF [Neisseriaceae bacterium]|nr:type VI secretion system baseplate subunit TssF [Neisseriaceae bacterium]MBP6863539.1 type VI secretion system baseplate subunit TssF [Neisseriaceae bacterium]
MRYLTQSGKDFAEAHPESARALNLDDGLEKDPMVERLFEGFAFLSARLRQKIDDDLPELTQSVLGLLWPHYLKPLPSLMVVRLGLNQNVVSNVQSIPAGVVLKTHAATPTTMACEFRTTLPVVVYPLAVVAAGLKHNEQGQSVIQLSLSLIHADNGQALQLPESLPLTFFLDAEPSVKYALHWALTNHVQSISLSQQGQPLPASDLAFAPTHWADESLSWASFTDGMAHKDYAMLMEYFAFKEKFLFVSLSGLKAAHFQAQNQTLTVDCVLSKNFPAAGQFDEQAFKLFCVPAINLFTLEAEPILKNQLSVDYKLTPMHHFQEQIEVYGVSSVESFSDAATQRKVYQPLSQFRHHADRWRGTQSQKTQPFYYAHTQANVAGGQDMYVTLSDEQAPLTAKEVLSIRLLGTNGQLPKAAIHHDRRLSLQTPLVGIGSVEAVTMPTPILYPPKVDRAQWQLLFEMSHNYLSVLDKEVLKNSLRLANWSDAVSNERNIDAIMALAHEVKNVMRQGLMVRCLVVTVTLDVKGYVNEGEAVLFGHLLHHFFSRHAELNLMTQLVLHIHPSGRVYEWPIQAQDRMAF